MCQLLGIMSSRGKVNSFCKRGGVPNISQSTDTIKQTGNTVVTFNSYSVSVVYQVTACFCQNQAKTENPFKNLSIPSFSAQFCISVR